MSPTRWTWCSATAPGTAAHWPTRSPRCPRSAPGSGTCGWKPPPTPFASGPATSPTPTSSRWPKQSDTCPAVTYEGDRVAHRRAVPDVRGGAGPDRRRHGSVAGRMPLVRLRRALRHRRRFLGRRLVTGTAGDRKTRAERLAAPLARNVVKEVAAEHGACLRPVQLRRTDIDTGHVEQVLIPCGHTLASVCPPCAERARLLRAAQCREGWHLDHEPVIEPDPANDQQQAHVADRAEAQADRDALAAEGLDTTELDERICELDQQISDAGIRGNVLPARARRHRSTRRRQDAAPLPRRPVSSRTIGKTYTAPDGKTFRPSMFVTLTCPSYGRVCEDGAPADPDAYDYRHAARDALHFAALFDRFIQNLRRFVGHDIQYFAAVEPQRRLAPHVHIAIRGTISRTELREVIAATYHQVWWPP